MAAAAGMAAAALLLAACSPSESPAEPGSTSTASTASDEAGTPPPSPSGGAAAGECAYTPTPQEPAAKPVDLPAQPTARTGTVAVTLSTNNGDIPLTIDRAMAPCTAQSIEHLAQAGFYDGSPCHRMVVSENFTILQCGDPTGQGNGGPGYTIPDENPTDLAPAPVGGGAAVYPRGVVAMANTGQPNSGGSQFFLVFGDTFLPPNYSIFGTIDETGLATLDRIGAAGVDPATDTSGRGDGAPALATTITRATVG